VKVLMDWILRFEEPIHAAVLGPETLIQVSRVANGNGFGMI